MGTGMRNGRDIILNGNCHWTGLVDSPKLPFPTFPVAHVKFVCLTHRPWHIMLEILPIVLFPYARWSCLFFCSSSPIILNYAHFLLYCFPENPVSYCNSTVLTKIKISFSIVFSIVLQHNNIYSSTKNSQTSHLPTLALGTRLRMYFSLVPKL